MVNNSVRFPTVLKNDCFIRFIKRNVNILLSHTVHISISGHTTISHNKTHTHNILLRLTSLQQLPDLTLAAGDWDRLYNNLW